MIALACALLIGGFGLGSERVRRFARDNLPASMGGGRQDTADLWKDPAVVTAEEESGEPDPNALPDIPREESFRGIVRDAEGNPIAGAVVTAERWRETAWERMATAVTNAEGRFVLGPLPKAHLSAVARAEGFGSERKPAVTGASLEFALKRGGTLAGRVVDAITGDAVPDCGLRGWSGRGNWYEVTRTDEKGEFRFESVPPGPVWLDVQPPRHRGTNLADLEVKAGEETFKEIPVIKGGTLKGKVLDRETRLPVAAARVRTWDGSKEALSAEDGSYEIESPPPGGISLRVSAPEYPDQWHWLQLGSDPDAEIERDIEIGKGGSVSGEVRSDTGDPVEGARVGRDPGRLMTGVPEETAVTDAEGKFTLEAVPAMSNGRIFASAEGWALSRSAPFDVRSGSETGGIVVTLQKGAVFKGTVKDEENNPLPGVSITMDRQWTPADGGWFWIPSLVAYSESDGTWSLEGVPEGNYRMRVFLEGFAPIDKRNVNAPATGEVGAQDFVLRKGDSIAGVVRSRDGDLLPGASVNAWGWVVGSDGNRTWMNRSDVRTDEEGAFLLDGLPSGSYQINVQLSGYGAKQMTGIAAGTRGLDITLEPMARIRGGVMQIDGVTAVPTFKIKVFQEMDADGNPMGDGRVIRQQDFADREGHFEIKDLPAGQYALQAISGDLVSGRSRSILVQAGSEVESVNLMVTTGARMRVVVRDANGQPLESANVSAGRRLVDGNFRHEGWAQTDKDGVATMAALQDGLWTVTAQYQGRLRETREVSLGGGVELDLDMTLRVGGTVVLHVRDEDGQPVADAYVALVELATGRAVSIDWSRVWNDLRSRSNGRVDWSRAQRLAQRTDDWGVHRRESVPPGRIQVQVTLQGFERLQTEVQVIDGFEIDENVVLKRTPGPEDEPGEGEPSEDLEDGDEEEEVE